MCKSNGGVFGELVKYELKKIFINKVTIIALILSTCLLAGTSLIEYIFISPEDRYIAKREGEIEGRFIDDKLIDDVADTATQFGSLTEIPGDNTYSHIGSYMNRALGTYMNIEGISGEYELSELTEEQFYRTRESILEYLYDYFCLSDAEKEYWTSKEAQIPKPFMWKTNYGLYSMRANISASITLAIFLIGICLSGVYAGELSHRMEDLILCTKTGKETIAAAKLISGGLFSAVVGGILFIAVNSPHVIFNGFNGWDTACQLIIPFTSYPYTSGKMLLVCFGVYMLASVLAGAIAMFLSCVLKNMVASAGVICGTVFVDLFFTIPHRFRVLSQMRFLTPIQVLINGSMTDPRLVHIGEHFWGTYQTAAILYVVLICVFCMLTYQAYMRVKR